MNNARFPFLLAACLLAVACQPSETGSAPAQAPVAGDLVGARIGGDFTLTDQTGKRVRWADFMGRYRLVYFGYTFCPDVCPVDLQRIMLGYRMLEQQAPQVAAKIQPIFITVDPQRDTPEALKTYVAAFHPRLIGLTGTVEEIEKVKQDFVVVASKDGDQAATQDYLVSHTRTPFLFDPDGKPLALVPIEPLTPEQSGPASAAIRDFLLRLVK
jgi:protein SCO1